MSSEIRDINLAESGERKIEWVKRNCDLLRTLEKEFSESKPFAGKKSSFIRAPGSENSLSVPRIKSGRSGYVCNGFQSVVHTG